MLAVMGFFAFFNCYTLRVNLSVAIVAMVNTTYLRELEAADATASNLTGNGSSDEANTTQSNVLDFHQVPNWIELGCCWASSLTFPNTKGGATTPHFMTAGTRGYNIQ